jgi:YD repeat-containing protein
MCKNDIVRPLAATPSASYAYDSNGNTTSKTDETGTTTYAWDYENRMSSATLPGTGGTTTGGFGGGFRVSQYTTDAWTNPVSPESFPHTFSKCGCGESVKVVPGRG